MSAKPHFIFVAGRPVRIDRTTPIEEARLRYGREFGREPFRVGEGARYWTADRVAQLAADNEQRRRGRK